ncbi:MAG TPA: SRPBCC family protein [Pseudonocardia sp.]
MASVRMDVELDADPTRVWEAVADVGAVSERLCPGVLLDSRSDGESRVVTFANGAVVRETIVDIDPEARRLVYAVAEGTLPFTHHQSSLEVRTHGSGTRIVWISDLLPHELAAPVVALMQQGADAMRSVFNTSP